MTNDDIAQKLALLPEGIEEENLRTWEEATDYYQETLQVTPEMISAEPISIYKHLPPRGANHQPRISSL